VASTTLSRSPDYAQRSHDVSTAVTRFKTSAVFVPLLKKSQLQSSHFDATFGSRLR
jgi:hypothetical protein